MRGMEEVDVWLDVTESMWGLTEKQAEALRLSFEGHTQQQIGQALGVSQQAVSRLIDRALETIRAGMG